MKTKDIKVIAPYLSVAEVERLAKLTEECGEISQMVGKTLVHGFENTHPRKPEEGTNRERLEREIGGLLCVIDIMTCRRLQLRSNLRCTRSEACGDWEVPLPSGGSMSITAEKANNIRHIVGEVLNEVMRASSMYLPMNSPHEAHSVIEEEFDEFWDEVKAYNLRKGCDTRPRMREELVQLAAMAVRAVTDVIDNGKADRRSPWKP